MRKILYMSKISIIILYIMLSSGCYTMINHEDNYSDHQNHETSTESDTLNVSENYTIINNYSCDSTESVCNHVYCHTQ